MSIPTNLKTWVEINQKAIEQNYRTFRSLLRLKTKLWAVVKSNAYGHGLIDFAKIADTLGVDGFCVDELAEGLKLRASGIKKPILALGPTLPKLLKDAAGNNLTVTVSNFGALDNFVKSRHQPRFHIKIDTGMHRQGFYLNDLPAVVKKIKTYKLKKLLTGAYTHFASAKDLNYPTYTDGQFKQFKQATAIFKKAGFQNLIRHVSATGGTLMSSKYHLDAVRLGIGLYGLWPSRELEMQCKKINLKPVLSWHTLISEIKNLHKDDFIGYDLVERVTRIGRMAVLPIGYWHGFSRNLSGLSEVLVNNKRARVLGRISMDLIVIDITDIKCRVGDRATVIGRQKNVEVTASEVAQKSNTNHYEAVTRINPLIERLIV